MPGPDDRGAGRARAGARRSRRRVGLRAARRGRLPQHRGRPRRRRESRRDLPQDAHPGRPALLREVLLHARAISGSARSTTAFRPGRHAGLLGPVVSRGGAADGACCGAAILVYPTAIGWHPAEKAEYGAAQLDAWRTIQRAHAIANGVYVAASTASATRARPAAASSSGARPSSAIRSGRSWPRRRDDRADVLVVDVRSGAARRPFGGTGRSCATAGSTPTARSSNACSSRDEPTAPGPAPAGRAGTSCPRSGSPTAPPGSPGPTTRPTGRASFGPIPWCLRRDRSRARTRRDGGASSSDAATEQRARRMLRAAGDRSESGRVPSRRHRSQLDPRHRADLRACAGRRGVAATLWRFNGWAKYPNHRRDDEVSAAIARAAGSPAIRVKRTGRGVVLEGGAIDVDGAGNSADDRGVPALGGPGAQSRARSRGARERCSPRPSASRRSSGWAAASPATTRTATSTTLPLRRPPAVVVLCAETDPEDANYAPLHENRERLEAARDAAGRKLDVVPLPMPVAARLRRRAAAGQLRQLLHRQRTGPRPRRSTTRATATPSASWPSSSPTARDRPIHCGRPGLGLGHAPLHDAAGAGRQAGPRPSP